MSIEVSEKKKTVRRHLSGRFLSKEVQLKKNQRAIFYLKQLILELKPQRIFSYFSINNEVNLNPLAFELADSFSWCLPVTKNQSEISFYQWKPRPNNEGLKEGRFGVFEPINVEKQDKLTPKSYSDIILVPCLATDLKCNRLGYGKGYYDRFLNKYNFVLKIGIVFHEFIFQELPVEEHDITLDSVCSENGLFSSGKLLKRYRDNI